MVDRYLQRLKLTQLRSSTIIENVAKDCEGNSGFALAYFYFDFTDSNKQKSASVIRSFLTQLCFQTSVCPDVLVRLHAQCQNGSQQASTTDLMRGHSAPMHVIYIDYGSTFCRIERQNGCPPDINNTWWQHVAGYGIARNLNRNSELAFEPGGRLQRNLCDM